MTPDDDPNFDPTGDPDAMIRDLEAQIVRLHAELDQVTARIREQEADMGVLRAEYAELRALAERVEAKIRREKRLRAWVLPLTWLMVVASIALSLAQLL